MVWPEGFTPFAEHGSVASTLAAGGGDSDEVLARFAAAGVDVAALAEDLLREGLAVFDASWADLLRCISGRSEDLTQAR